jgi:hypothetical protein
MLVNQPMAREVAESVDNLLGRAKRAIAVVQRDPNAAFTEPDHIGTTIPGHISHEARMLLHSPITGTEAEIINHLPRSTERAIAVIQ